MTAIPTEFLKASASQLHDIQHQHRAEPRRVTFGRRPQVEMRCVACKQFAPCDTWHDAQAELEKLADR